MEYEKPTVADFGSIVESTFSVRILFGKDTKLCTLDKFLGDSCTSSP